MQARRMLLLNTTNHPVRVAFPYAFVQVSEVARRFGIEVVRFDLFGLSPAGRAHALRKRLEATRPDLIGVTLRNTDSLLSADYTRYAPSEALDQPASRNLLEVLTEGTPPYFPTHDTRDLIALLRTLSDRPIVVGGFGFATQPERLMRFLGADFGVVGDPLPVFERLDDLLQRRNLEGIDNLCYLDGEQVRINRRVFVGPSPNREYDDAILADRSRLFGAFSAKLPSTSRAVPVEVMRGCPFRCTFCSEPAVKGNRAVFRDLDLVTEELEFLRTHDLNLIWFICSEINAMGNAFALQLAERLIRLNEKRPEAERVRWFTYYLLRFDREELRTLRRAGFLGGWNDIPAFDDRNLKQLRVPYRTRHLLQSIRDVIAIREEERGRPDPAFPPDEQLVFDPEHRRSILPDDMLTSRMLTLFLGNQHATVDSVRETLRVMDAENLASRFDAAFVIRGERVFEHVEGAESESAGDASANATVSFERQGVMPEVDFVRPTYRFAPALVRQLGSREALERFFVHVEDTFLSRNHLFRKDWCWFLARTLSPTAFHQLWTEALAAGAQPLDRTTLPVVRAALEHVTREPTLERTQLLFHPPTDRRNVVGRAADVAIRVLLEQHAGRAAAVLDTLEVPQAPRGTCALSEYQLAAHLYARVDTEAALLEHVRARITLAPDSLEWLALRDLLYRNNVRLTPEHKPFFAAPAVGKPGVQGAASAAE